MYKIVTPAINEPVTVLEVKRHLRLTDSPDEDDLLQHLIMAAREYCEHFTRRALAEQTIEQIFDSFPAASSIELSCPPLRSVLWIKVRDNDGIENTLSPDTYGVDNDREPGRVVLLTSAAWPVFTPDPVSPIRIRFVAGYEQLPNTIRQALFMLIGHWFENREATGTVSGEIQFSVHALLASYRVEAF